MIVLRRSVNWPANSGPPRSSRVGGTLVAGNDDLPVRVCSYGNPAMATAGMGDALTGIIASLIGQGLNDLEAASTGVLLHALAGDLAAQ